MLQYPLRRDKTCPSTDGIKAPAFRSIFKYARQSLASSFDIAGDAMPNKVIRACQLSLQSY